MVHNGYLDQCDTCGKLYYPGMGGHYDPTSEQDICIPCMQEQKLEQCGYCQRLVPEGSLDRLYRCPGCKEHQESQHVGR